MTELRSGLNHRSVHLNKHLSNVFHACTVLGAGDTKMNKTLS